MKKGDIGIKNFRKILFCVGIGGLLTYYLIEWGKLKLPVVLDMVENWISTGYMNDLHIGMHEMCIFSISVFLLLLVPLMGNWNQKTGIQAFLLLLLILINVGGVITVIGRGEIFPLFIYVVWITSAYIIWLSIGTIKMIYLWTRVKETDGKLDVVKLTLIWTVIAFVLGKLW